jgi:guanine deaminase
VARDGIIIAEGANLVTAVNDPTAHAEIVAIRRACDKLGVYSLSGYAVYSSCEPCPMCHAAICWAHVDRVFFAAAREDAARAGFDDARVLRELIQLPGARGIPMTHLPVASEQSAFDAWDAKADKTRY